MILYLDDVRNPSKDWVVCRNAADAMTIIEGCWDRLCTVSLDHDLGTHETGYTVMCFIEQQAHARGTLPFTIFVHSANPVGVQKMQTVINSLRYKFR